MTYLQLYDKARKLLDNSEITLGEYLDMIEPLGDKIIVRCKDCKYYNAETETRPSPCPMLFTLYDATPTDFCSRAKMKGGNK